MLKIKIYANSELNLPEIELSGNNAKELLYPYLELVPLTKDCITDDAKLKNRLVTLGLDVKNYYKRNNTYFNTSCLAIYLVQTNKAIWLEYNADELNPKLAANQVRANNVQNKEVAKKREASRKKQGQTMRDKFANMTAEEKQKYFINSNTTAARAKVAQDIANMTAEERYKYFHKKEQKNNVE